MSGAMIKGIIMNMSTGSFKTFQFNPNNISYGREAVYAEIGSPGMSYPRHQYVSGRAREFSVTLFMYDHPYSGKIDSFRAFLEDFLPPEYNTRTFIKPPQMLFFYGTFLKKCVLVSLNSHMDRHNKYGLPIQARFDLTLRQVSV